MKPGISGLRPPAEGKIIMENGTFYIYLICAALGGALMGCQFVMTLLGLGGDHDLDTDHGDMGGHDLHDVAHHDAAHHAGHEHHSSWFVGVLTFRTVVAAVAFFGLGGLAALMQQLGEPIAFVIALAAGAAALFLVAWMMRSLHKLQAEGTAKIDRAVGKIGTVYLPIPGQKAGAGKVHLNLQNRTVEYQAITSQETLPVGVKVVVVGVTGSDTVEVVPATAPGRVSHV
jgi:membrane protein implicated in regulation of membrane protease activity